MNATDVVRAKGFAGHWTTLPVTERCSGGNERRYCCDPAAWENIAADFGDRAFCQGGFIDWFGEPLDPLLCQLATEHDLDPHEIFDDDRLNYKPHKTWWTEHVTAVVTAARMRRTEDGVASASENGSGPRGCAVR